MAKYIIDIPEKGKAYYTTSDLIPYTASESYIDGLKKGQDEAWEFAKLFMDDIGVDDLEVVNGDTIKRYFAMTYSECKAKYELWKKQKDEIRVGNEVVYHGNKYVVGYVGADEVYHIVDRNWIRVVVQGDYQIFKTGRHFPEVVELLKKMNEES